MRILLLLGVPLLMAGLAATAEAQGGPPRQRIYNPSPKISPYLYLSRGNVSGLPSYYAWVRPQINYNQRVRIVENELRSLETQQTNIQQDVIRLNDPQRGIGPPSTASRYMQYQHMHYSHYYAVPKLPPK